MRFNGYGRNPRTDRTGKTLTVVIKVHSKIRTMNKTATSRQKRNSQEQKAEMFTWEETRRGSPKQAELSLEKQSLRKCSKV